jgi:DNA-binding transcriptional regulator YiaG
MLIHMAMTAEEFKEARLELGMTQQEIAEALGIALRTAQYYEGCGGSTRIPGPVQLLLTRELERQRQLRRRREAATNAV